MVEGPSTFSSDTGIECVMRGSHADWLSDALATPLLGATSGVVSTACTDSTAFGPGGTFFERQQRERF